MQRAKEAARACIDLLAEKEGQEEQAVILDAAIHFLQQHGLMRQIRHLPRLLQEAWHERQGTVPAIASTPHGDLGEECKVIQATLGKAVGKKVVLEERADLTLIGGSVLAIGDERLDRSLRGALEQLQTHLATPETAS